MREKAHTREGDAIAATRRRLPMVEVSASTPLIGERGPVTQLDTFEGRRLLIAYCFMWNTGKPALEQCEGCTWVTSQVRELCYIHARDVAYATFCQGPYDESARHREFMGWGCLGIQRLALSRLFWWDGMGRQVGMMHLVCYLRQGSQSLRNLLDDDAGRGGHGQQLSVAGPDRLGAAGAVGGFAGWLAAAAKRQGHDAC